MILVRDDLDYPKMPTRGVSPRRHRPGSKRAGCILAGRTSPTLPVVGIHRGDPARSSLSGICGAVGWDIGPVAGAVTVDAAREALADDVSSATHHGAVNLVPVGDRAVVGAAR